MGGYAAGNLRANPFIYKMATQDGDEGSVITLNVEGVIGSYNRGNRSLHHFLENSLPFVISLPIVGYIFPFATFILVSLFCIGRIAHQIGYAKGGWGGHVIGFLISRIVQSVVMGLLIVVYLKMVIM